MAQKHTQNTEKIDVRRKIIKFWNTFHFSWYRTSARHRHHRLMPRVHLKRTVHFYISQHIKCMEHQISILSFLEEEKSEFLKRLSSSIDSNDAFLRKNSVGSRLHQSWRSIFLFTVAIFTIKGKHTSKPKERRRWKEKPDAVSLVNPSRNLLYFLILTKYAFFFFLMYAFLFLMLRRSGHQKRADNINRLNAKA